MNDRHRFPRDVYEVGEEPDPRFSLANERTFLAWIRTALALIAGGVALEALGLPLHPVLRLAAAMILLLLGLTVPVASWISWAAVEKAIRRGAPLPSTYVGVTVAVGVSLVAVLVILGYWLR